MAPPPSSTVEDVILADSDALDCSVCFHPLHPPIYQCAVGHVVCAPCRDKLIEAAPATGGACHVCGATAGYHRCHAMETLVGAVLVPCLHAAHGCKAKPVYNDRDRHARACAHAPCTCPAEACGFAAPAADLLPHLAAAHRWPCTTKLSASDIVSFAVQLREGFNFVHAGAGGREGRRWSHLFLLDMAVEDAGCAVTVLCIHPQATPPSREIKFELEYSGYADVRCRDRLLVNHYQKSEFRVLGTDLSKGLPGPDNSFLFLVPGSVLADDQDTIQVTASAYLIN